MTTPDRRLMVGKGNLSIQKLVLSACGKKCAFPICQHYSKPLHLAECATCRANA